MCTVRRWACLLLPLVCGTAVAAPDIPTAGERRVRFTSGWTFFKGDAPGAEQPDFDDAQWRKLDLPHDWAIEGPFDPKYNPHSGGLPFYGIGWYRKTFTTAALKGRYVSVEFDGAMSNSRVWLNGHELGGRPYGYIGFSFDLTPHLKPAGEKNVIAVRLAPEDRSSRWYPGAGIYRNVWIDITGPVHVARWGTYVTTSQVSETEAGVAVKTEVRNRRNTGANVVVQSTVMDAAGNPVSRGGDTVKLAAGATETVSAKLIVKSARRWDIENPYLYTLVTEVLERGRTVDRYETPFGIRTIAFDKARGFLLNGRALKLQGVCLHHDLGALGAAVNRRATERQLQIMKSMGVNAIRTSHNPPSPELLEYCDRLGLMVMDEAFDVWQRAKIPNDYSKYFAEWSERDARAMIRRDRNHPSIVLYSIGNEILEQGRPEGAQIAERLTKIFHEEDSTRPVTAGFNQSTNAIKNGLAAKVDIPGFNYKPYEYEGILRDHPDWIIVGAETSSAVSSRGVYHLPLEKYEKHPSLEITSYDIISPPWAYIPDVEFHYQEKLPNVLGEFVWTGFDYLGEPTPYFLGRTGTDKDWPARSSYFGIVDLAGFPKDRYYLYQSVWTKKPMVHVLPHWNWSGMEGKPIPVMAYTNAEEVELFVNGKSLGRKKRGSEPVELPVGKNVGGGGKFQSRYRLMWEAPYAPGALRVIAYTAGKQVASDEVKTAGAPAKLRLIPDRTSIGADGEDLSFVTVRVEDKDGNLCPSADNLVRFRVTGAGVIAAVDNGNPATVEPFQAEQRKAFSGMALLIVRSKAGVRGPISVQAESDGIAGASTTLQAGGATTEIKVDQAGYLPNAPKVAVVAASAPAMKFMVRSAGGAVAYTGELSAGQSDADTGDTVQRADFTKLVKPGRYYIEVPGVGRSYEFAIGADAYSKAFYLAMRSFYGQRCGTDVDLGNGYSYKACHLDGAYHATSGKSGPQKSTKGWHDAGDYGRYVVNSGITTGTLLHAWEMFRPQVGRVKLDIPESKNATPDMLDEIRWNLEWMLSMQDTDGGVWHKQTTEKFCGFVMPEKDTMTSYVIGTGKEPYKSSCATADFAAVMAIAARVYKTHDAAFAARCRKAAEQAWTWLESNPNVLFNNPPGITTGAYGDRDCSDERLWASAELWRTTAATKYNRYFLGNYEKFRQTLRPVGPPSWASVAPLGLWSYALATGADAAAAQAIREESIKAADAIVARTSASAYQNSMTTRDYIWGSNSVAANYGVQLLIANAMKPNPKYKAAAMDNLHYLLGRNTFSLSWVTQLGQNPFRHPHHRPSGADTNAEPWLGLLSGGPNARRQDPAMKNLPDLPPAKMYLDDQESYATNEIAINWNAPLVFLLAGSLPETALTPSRTAR